MRVIEMRFSSEDVKIHGMSLTGFLNHKIKIS